MEKEKQNPDCVQDMRPTYKLDAIIAVGYRVNSYQN